MQRLWLDRPTVVGRPGDDFLSRQRSARPPEMESFISRFKTENRPLLLDAQTLADLQLLAGEVMGHHNGDRRHSMIGHQPPAAYVVTLSQGRGIIIPAP